MRQSCRVQHCGCKRTAGKGVKARYSTTLPAFPTDAKDSDTVDVVNYASNDFLFRKTPLFCAGG